MMAFITLVPARRNDGTPVGRAERDDIIRSLWERFGGATIEGIVEGHWIDPADGTHYHERTWKVVVAVHPDRLEEGRQAVVEIGRRLGQVAMYFEVRDGIDILDVPNQ